MTNLTEKSTERIKNEHGQEKIYLKWKAVARLSHESSKPYTDEMNDFIHDVVDDLMAKDIAEHKELMNNQFARQRELTAENIALHKRLEIFRDKLVKAVTTEDIAKLNKEFETKINITSNNIKIKD